MATGGKPSTWFPPGGLVEQDTLLKNSIQTNPFHHEEEQKEFRNKGINKTNNWKRTQPKTLFPKNMAEKMHHEIMKKKGSDVKRFTIKQKDWRNKNKIIKSLLRNKKKDSQRRIRIRTKAQKLLTPAFIIRPLMHEAFEPLSFFEIFCHYQGHSNKLKQNKERIHKNNCAS